MVLGALAGVSVRSQRQVYLGQGVGRAQAVNTTNLLFGNVLGATWSQIWSGVVVAVGAGTFFVAQVRKIALIGMAPDVAGAHGVRVRRLEVAQIVMVAVSVATFVQVAGTLPAIVALVIPTAVAHCWSRSILGLHAIGVAAAVIAAVIGLYASYWSDIPSGPALPLTSALMYLLSVVSTRRR